MIDPTRLYSQSAGDTRTTSGMTDVRLQLQECTMNSESGNASDNSYYVLNEFEEIERLIQENTAAESNDERVSGVRCSPVICWTNTLSHDTSGMVDRSELGDFTSHVDGQPDVQQTSAACPHRDSSTDSNITVDDFVAGRNQCDLVDYHETPTVEDTRLVATFGTTEKFEVLLEQQLYTGEVNDNNSGDEKILQDNGQTSHFHNEDSDDSVVLSESMFVMRSKKKSGERVTRSPAANRVMRAKWSGGRSHFPQRESSDDVSVHSDVSRTELRQRLKKESRGRKKDKEVVKQLQTDYDDLLTKYAEAENVIDQLRVGAKIDLFAKLPTYEDMEKLPSSCEYQSSDKIASFPTHKNSDKVAGSVNSSMEKSLQLPLVATMEFERVALNQQAQDLKDQIESFNALLGEGCLEDIEKIQALCNIEKALTRLEHDYISAGNKYETEKRIEACEHGRIAKLNEEFDPASQIEAQISRLGRMVDGLKADVSINKNTMQIPQLCEVSAGMLSHGQLTHSDHDDSIGNVDDNFNDLLQRYDKNIESVLGATAHSTASSADPDSCGTTRSLGVAARTLHDPPTSVKKTPNSDHSGHLGSKELSTEEGRKINRRCWKAASSPREQQGFIRSRLPRPVTRNLFPAPTGPSHASTSHLPADDARKDVSKQEFETDSGFGSTIFAAGTESSRLPGTAVTYPAVAGKLQATKQSSNLITSVKHSDVKRKKEHDPHTDDKIRPFSNVGRQNPAKVTRSSNFSPDKQNSTIRDKNLSQANLYGIGHGKKKEGSLFCTVSSRHSREGNDKDVEQISGEDSRTSSSTDDGLHTQMNVVIPGASGSPVLMDTGKDFDCLEATKPDIVNGNLKIKRSQSTSSRDSALDQLRGEIAKLRADMRQVKSQGKVLLDPSSASTPNSPVRKSYSKNTGPHIRPWNDSTGERAIPRTDVLQRHLQSIRSSVRPSPDEEKSSAAETTAMPAPGHWIYVSPCVFPARGVQLTPTNVSHRRYYITPPLCNHAYDMREASDTSVVFRSSLAFRRNRRRSNATMHIVQNVDDEEVPSRSRSRMTKTDHSLWRSCRLPVDHRLRASLDRAETASGALCSKSGSMYHSIRDSSNKQEAQASMML